ncbi:VanZ family protein [Flavobacterium sp. Arc3]|jgi:glycopeptide antibiotics resistance protein|uniref:VanZ family protein n=1 Tax=unclassified Flavobacterium TaxID=196869 RepID=UPI00352BEC0D
MSKKIIRFLLLLVIVAVFYYSWLPDPNMRSENYLPQWLLNWSNENFNVRTAIPFVVFGYLLEAYSFKKNSQNKNVDRKFVFIRNLGVSAVVVIIAECGQFLIKNRSPDFMDIYFGIIGSLVGAFGYNLFNKKLRNA